MNAAQTADHSSGGRRGARSAVGAADLGGPRASVPRGILIIGGVAAALVAALGLRAFSDVVAPVFLGLVLSITVQPLRRLPARRGLPGWVGTVLSLVAVYAIVAALLFILVVSGVQLAGLLDDYAPQFQAFLSNLNERLTNAGFDTSQVQALVAQASPRRLIHLAPALLGGVAGILSSVFFLVLLLFFTVTDAATFTTHLIKV